MDTLGSKNQFCTESKDANYIFLKMYTVLSYFDDIYFISQHEEQMISKYGCSFLYYLLVAGEDIG